MIALALQWAKNANCTVQLLISYNCCFSDYIMMPRRSSWVKCSCVTHTFEYVEYQSEHGSTEWSIRSMKYVFPHSIVTCMLIQNWLIIL